MAWDVLSGAAKMAWDVLSGVTKTAWDVLSEVANRCGMFCPGCQKMAWDVLSRDVLSYIRNITYASECYLDRDHCLCVTQQPGCQSATQGIIILCGGLYLL